MKTIVVTCPEFLLNEDRAITTLFENGLQILHLRKPNSAKEALEELLKKIPLGFVNRIVLHDHFELSNIFTVKGIHLNSRNNKIPDNFRGQLSTSCHSINEVVQKKDHFDYVFLSPIFDSISKTDYTSSFNDNQLKDAAEQKIIDSKVVALGGITPNKVSQIRQWQFGGYAVLGYLWDEFARDFDINNLIRRFLKYKQYS